MPTRIDSRSAILLTGLAFIWGSSFFFAAIALQEVPPITLTLFRVILAIPLLALIIWFRGERLPRETKVWRSYLVMGTLNNAIPFSLIFWGQTQITSGLSSILNGATGVTGVIVVIGVIIGFLGVIVTLGVDTLQSFNILSLGQFAILLAGLSYSFAGVWAKLRLAGQSAEMNAFGMLTCSCILMFPITLWVDGIPNLDLMTNTWVALITLAVFCTSVAYLLYFKILKRAGSGNLMLVTLLIPPVAVTLGVFVLGESIRATSLIGFALIALGLVVVDGRTALSPKKLT